MRTEFLLRGHRVLQAIVIWISSVLFCAGGQVAAVSPAAAQDGAKLTVPFITLRDKTGGARPSAYFGDKRDKLRAGFCDVSRTSLDVLKPVAANASFYVPDEILNLNDIREAPKKELWESVEMSRQGKRPLLYTHGFFMSFARGCRRAAVLQQSLQMNGRMVLFSWPSDGGILSYARDESDMYWSVAALEQTVGAMLARFGVGNFDLAAHSLGARGLFLALISLASANQGTGPIINNVVLFAPDIDAGIFAQYVQRIEPLARKITVYASPNDQPLALSRQVHGYPRLGEVGDHLDSLGGVEIIDLSDVAVRFPSGHVYHLYNKYVGEDLAQLINDNKGAAQRKNMKQAGPNRWRLQADAANK